MFVLLKPHFVQLLKPEVCELSRSTIYMMLIMIRYGVGIPNLIIKLSQAFYLVHDLVHDSLISLYTLFVRPSAMVTLTELMKFQDHDGSHIKGLLINFIHKEWPSLLKVPSFLVEFITPIIKVGNSFGRCQMYLCVLRYTLMHIKSYSLRS